MNKNKRTIVTFLVFSLLLVLSAFACVMLGSVSLPLSRILAAIRGEDRLAAVILFDLRLPRFFAATLAGIGLSVAGTLLQTVTDNNLCAPNIIGVNSGAGLFVMITLCVFPTLWQLLPFAAFVGAFLATLAVLAISKLGRNHKEKTTLILAGVALSSLLNSGISFLSLKYPEVLSSYTAFSVGGFAAVKAEQLLVPSVIILLGLSASLVTAPKVRLLCLGDDGAASLGVNVGVTRVVAIMIASALCASVVSFAGLLGFAGLIVPHISRQLIGGDLRKQLPLSALCGSVIVSFADLVGRTLFSPWEVPAGIIMSFIGAPFFLYLIVRRRKANDRM